MGYTEPGSIMTQSMAEAALRKNKLVENSYKQISDQLSENIFNLNQAYDAERKNVAATYDSNLMSLGMNFRQNMADAFNNITNAKNSFLENSASLGTGARQQAELDLEKMASSAYDNYIKNYLGNKKSLGNQFSNDLQSLETSKLTDIQSLIENASKSTSEIDNFVSTQATNYASLYNAPREYLQYLIDKEYINQATPGFENYFDVNYVNGEPVYNVKSKDKLDSMMYEYDENGNILHDSNGYPIYTEFGKNFYNQILYGTGDLPESFNAWLAGTNRNLYDWAFSSDANGLNTNLYTVFTEAGLNPEMIGSQSYNSNNYNTEPKIDSTTKSVAGMGSVTLYGKNNTVAKLSGFKVKGLNAGHALDKNENFRIEGHDGNDILFKINKKDTVSDDVYNAIVKAEGKLNNNEIHAYNNELYISLVDENGKVILKKLNVSSQKESDRLWKMIKETDTHNKESEKKPTTATNTDFNPFNPLDYFTTKYKPTAYSPTIKEKQDMKDIALSSTL